MTRKHERVFTLEIDEQPILTFAARTLQEAQTLTREGWLQEDLRHLKSKSVAIWDGKSRLSVRGASTSEAGRYEREAKHQPGDDLVIVYLIDLY